MRLQRVQLIDKIPTKKERKKEKNSLLAHTLSGISFFTLSLESQLPNNKRRAEISLDVLPLLVILLLLQAHNNQLSPGPTGSADGEMEPKC